MLLRNDTLNVTCCARLYLQNTSKHSLTCTRASVNLVLCASSSLVYTSGYCVLSNALSNSSSCSAVKVVLARRCFLLMGMPGSLSVSLSEIEPPPPAGEIDTSRSASVAVARTRGYEKLSTSMEKLQLLDT